MYYVNEANGIYQISSNGRVISYSGSKDLQESIAKELNQESIGLRGENENSKKTRRVAKS